MRARHNSSDVRYRDPFGAAPVGGSVALCLDVWDEPDATAQLRVWVDEKGERLFDMDRSREGDHLCFSVTITPEEPEVIWYSFRVMAADGSVWRYGAAGEHACGEGAFAYGEPPSFQITVYEQQRTSFPDWYTGGIVYQIFPDRFRRGSDWEGRVHDALDKPRRGPERRLVEDWDEYPRYQRNEDGSIAAWDFYGGTLEGVREKLDYLKALGVTALYLNPIFEAASSHRYDTADYLKVDPMLGDLKSFRRLCRDAGERGISVILDGVFNHAGRDSKYFDAFGNYGGKGASSGDRSRYRDWFRFNEDGSCSSWWGVKDLPDLNQENPEYRDFVCGRGGVIRKWLRAGARGWRLDVADELSDEFIEDIKSAELAESPDALLLGEVWEDASHKVAYGKLRRYFQGSELDGTMNYPLRSGLEDFLTNKIGARQLAESLEALRENYPRTAFYSALNLLGSHDRARLLTILGDAPDPSGMSDEERYRFRLDQNHRSLAVSRLWVAALLQMTLPGVPCIYYGDEAGMEGYSDPYNRAAFPWGHEDKNCATIYRNAIAVRKSLPVFVNGDFESFALNDDVFGFWRTDGDEVVCVLANASLSSSHSVRVPMRGERVDDVVSGRVPKVEDGEAEVFLWPLGTSVLYFHKRVRLQAPMHRGMGVLAHVTSIPNRDHPGQPGTLGEPCRRFVDYLAAAHQRYWQVLPVNPTDGFGSPYAGLSAFAGNRSLMWGVEGEHTSFRSDFEGTASYRRFIEKNEDWLIPYATFRAIKEKLGEVPWQEWPKRYRTWDPSLGKDPELVHAVMRECATQYEFQRQWDDMHRYAREHGIKLVGDMPMYVSADSSDVWAERQVFKLDERGYPALQAGTPPDGFAKGGQLWGNPTYDWDFLRKDGYSWWMRRFQRAFELYDYVRLDHFLGFSSYYTIPQGKGALDGAWNFGPGIELFDAARRRFGQLPFVAEDLGTITPAVRALVAATGFPGMDVIQFSDEDVRQGYHPKPEKVVYSSTHDTSTLLGWCQERFEEDDPDGQGFVVRSQSMARGLLDECLDTDAEVVMVPLQDVLMLDDGSRMNVPGVAEGNWSWQARQADVEASAELLKELAERSGRA
ncbi:hypothetical protein HMPREF1008_00561 [Olsenella sp. oral taxon 809 str. F0356]|uniref:4-alpha-glucanotransferase n=1 Tax=Olsenella sp. oral taxon 809 TaxID=661086 RepID=UPI000231F303|nr:4-alpha-glucanotransferase [Olsenella sp. oral taxon 809]EHF02916.1 hypothetical protein HMPREF1008_00561 [Olsenella sp. oral taxon 809 str. F0356]